MKKLIRSFVLLSSLTVALAACSVFEDQSPENLGFRLEGQPGTTVMAIYSTEFVAAVNEVQVTQVRVFRSDTVMATLPIDTIISIVENQQFFVQIEPMPADTVNAVVRVDVDGRTLVDNSGLIFPESPWNYVYQFNQLLTDLVEVVL